MYGQWIYVDTERGVVVAKQSSAQASINPVVDRSAIALLRDIKRSAGDEATPDRVIPADA
jgi:hypothetical protein